MTIFTYSLSEAVPFLDTNKQVIQMKNFEVIVSGSQEPWETSDEVREKVRVEYDKQREYIQKKIPIYRLQERQLIMLRDKLQDKCSQHEFDKIILEVKSIK